MRVFGRSEVARRLPWGELIGALRTGFERGCEVPLRHHHTVALDGEPDATLLLMPAWQAGSYLGVKIATVFPGNATRGRGAVEASYVLSSAMTGEPLALIDGLELTQRRTAAASALAASYLVRADAQRMLMIGAGRLAPYLVAAHLEIRPQLAVEVWARRHQQAEELVARLECEGVAASFACDREEAVRRADLVSCATLSKEPLVLGRWLRPGCHLDLVGGYTPQMREADDQAVARSEVFVDTRAGALVEAGDLVQPLASGALVAGDVRADLFELARGLHPGRASELEVTLFKSVGTALEDLCAAALVWEGSGDSA